MDAPYYDQLLEREINITNEYITPHLTNNFETTAIHAAAPTIENEIIQWEKTAEIETAREREVEVIVQQRLKKEDVFKHCAKRPFFNKRNNKKTNKQMVNKVDTCVKQNEAKELDMCTVKTDDNKKLYNMKEKQRKVKNNTTINSSKDTTNNSSSKNTTQNTTECATATTTAGTNNKGSTTVEVLRIDLKNIHYRMKTPEQKKIEASLPNPLLIEQNISEEKELPMYATNILNKNNTCNMSTLLCDIRSFFNCIFGDAPLNNDKSNDTEMTVYEINAKNESYDTEALTIKSSMSVSKGIVSNIKDKEEQENENRKWDTDENSPFFEKNAELTNSESDSYKAEPLVIEDTCSDNGQIETRNSNMSTERKCYQTELSNSILLQMEENQPTIQDISYLSSGNYCTKDNNKKGKQIKKKKEVKKRSKKNRHTYLCVNSNLNKQNNVNIHTKNIEVEDFNLNQVDENVVFIQIENFSRKIEEYIADEKIFRAQKLIEHVKKYTEFYINYFQHNGSNLVVEKLLNYYKENCANNNNVKYNINSLKSHIILYFLNFFHLTEMVNILNEYCYYFSVDPLTNYDTSDTTSENNDVSSTGNENNNLTKMTEGAVVKYPSHSCSNSDIEFSKENPLFFNISEEINVSELNKDKVVIVDKFYHQHFIAANIISNTGVILDDSIIQEHAEKNSSQQASRKEKPKHIRRFLKKYSKRLKRFRKHKRNKEGWIKENDKFLDLWYQVDNDNNISVHVRAKLPYEVNRILCILNETDVSVNWAPFLTSAQKIKHLSKASAIITQLYEYPVIGKKESIMYCLGANALEELGCIILCCKAPPDFARDILFYENMCEKLQINKHGEIIKIRHIPTNTKKTCKEITFFDFLMPQPTAKIDRQRAADLCFLLYPLNDGKATVLELFLHFEVDFKYTPMKMVTYFIKKIVRNMYENIVKCCKNYEKKYSYFLKTNKEFYDWLDGQIQKFLKTRNDIKLIDTISLRSYNEPETNE